MAIAPVQMRAGVGWQYAFTDMALILFMVSAAALAKAPAAGTSAPPPARPAAPPELADPVGLWRPAPGMPGLAEWLARQPRDARQRLTIVARYAGSDAAPASARAAALLREAGTAAGPVRLVVEPGEADDLAAALTWDAGAVPAPKDIKKP
ncbi:hypothetical protein [Novosphingobium sp. TH158]|uniref:hypothetical protein n=1 Tax=Novosphingobium sp. TH158 TaxID=2067455 RepID=UPI000CB9F783|nr:hypothetical protein [Novosphingobium sp. TH158]PLK27654.1 hypothetical protein C0V78_12740 [Novosphingobium sp. TH158]